jgi:type IV secretory pathway TraG/TraD family ATPase VirD4
VILGGLAHADDLHRISKLAGDVDEPTRTRTAGAGGTSTSTAARRLPALPIEKVRTLPAGHAIVLARRTPPIHARLQPWWQGPHATAIRHGLQQAPRATAERRGEPA